MSIDVEIDKATRANPEDALRLALEWVAQESSNAKAWSKLAHVYEIRHEFKDAISAARKALALKPAHPPYLFKLGCSQFREGSVAEAAVSFELCVKASLDLGDPYYVDSAKVAQARCLLLSGHFQRAVAAVEAASPSAATWLDGRVTVDDILAAAAAAAAATKKRSPGAGH